jgi:hypothetical protein
MKLYTVLIHCLQICMKEYGCCPKFGRGDNLTSSSLHTECISEYKLNYLPFQILDSNHIPSCTSAGSALQLLLNASLDLNETLHSCNTLPADVHEGIWLLSKIWKGR